MSAPFARSRRPPWSPYPNCGGSCGGTPAAVTSTSDVADRVPHPPAAPAERVRDHAGAVRSGDAHGAPPGGRPCTGQEDHTNQHRDDPLDEEAGSGGGGGGQCRTGNGEDETDGDP